MKEKITMTLVCNLVAIISVTFAGMMAYHGLPNWGWFLGAAMVSVTTPRNTRIPDSDKTPCNGSSKCCRDSEKVLLNE